MFAKQANKIGLNNCQGSELKLHLDAGEIIADDTSWNPYEGFRITPLDFKVGMSLEYDLRFHFENKTEDLVSQTSISLTAENNSYCPSVSRLQQDGKAQYLFSKTGYYNLVVITSEKYKYINNAKCREMSYTQIVFEQVSEIIQKKCHPPCTVGCPKMHTFLKSSPARSFSQLIYPQKYKNAKKVQKSYV